MAFDLLLSTNKVPTLTYKVDQFLEGRSNGDPSFSLGVLRKNVYICTEDYAGGNDLYTMDANSNNPQLILKCDAELLKMNDPTFSLDVSRIIIGAVVRENQNGTRYSLSS